MRFADRVVLVTGSSRNTGLGIAAAFAEEGATVVVNGTTAEGVDRAVAQLHQQGHERVVGVAADLSQPSQVEALFAAVDSQAGPLDVLVNNAVRLGVGHGFLETPLDTLQADLAVNVVGLFQCSQLAARRMVGRGGAVVHIGSNVSERAIRARSGYVASKGAVDSLTRAMAIELAPHGIRVNTVAPGYIITERWDHLSQATIDRRHANVPLAYAAADRDVAAAVLFLASDAARSITGARLVVDGGSTAQLYPADTEG